MEIKRSSSADVTGSIGRNPIKQNPARPAPAVAPVTAIAPVKSEADKMPIALGSARLRNAAAAGDAAAAYEVATRFSEGRGIPADTEEAARWYEQACEGREPLGCLAAGEAHLAGDGIRADRGRAAVRFERACAAGVELGCVRAAAARRTVPLTGRGCACDSGGPAAGWPLLAVLSLALLRRRRGQAQPAPPPQRADIT